MGGKSDSGTQTQTATSEPWGPVQPFLKKAFPMAESEILNKPKEYYPGSTVVGFSPQTETALNWAQQRAMASSPLLRNAQAVVNNTAGGAFLPGFGMGGMASAGGGASVTNKPRLPGMNGDFGPTTGQESLPAHLRAPGAGGASGMLGHNGGPALDGEAGPMTEAAPAPGVPAGGSGNPWLDATVRKAQESVRGGIDSQFAAGGRYGSGMHMGSLASAFGDIATDIYGGAYESERARQMQAAAMAPGMAAADYDDIARLAAVGAQREAKAAEEMDDTINRWNFQQGEAGNRLRDYLALLNGGYGGTSTQTSTVSGGGGDDFGSTLLGLGSLGLRAYTAFSDRRLKRDIVQIGSGATGLPLYAFRYLWSPQLRVGHMADEVRAVAPQAVFQIGGFDVVDYAAIS